MLHSLSMQMQSIPRVRPKWVGLQLVYDLGQPRSGITRAAPPLWAGLMLDILTQLLNGLGLDLYLFCQETQLNGPSSQTNSETIRYSLIGYGRIQLLQYGIEFYPDYVNGLVLEVGTRPSAFHKTRKLIMVSWLKRPSNCGQFISNYSQFGSKLFS